MAFYESADDAATWNSTSADEAGHSVTRNVFVVLVYGSITLVTIIGNLMVIIAFTKDSRIHTKISNWYILNLSVADFTVGLVSMSVNLIWLITDDWPFGEIPCKIFLVVDYVATNVPVCTIIFISLDRYWLLTKKLDYGKYQTKRTAKGLIIFAWTFCSLYFVVLTFAWIPITGYEEEIDYSWNCELEATYHLKFQLFMICLFFVLPLLTIAYLNFVVYRNIRKRSKGFVQSKPTAASEGTGSSAASHTSEGQEAIGDNGVSRADSAKSSKGGLALVSLRIQKKTDSMNRLVRNTRPNTSKESAEKKRKEFNRHRKAAITLAVLVCAFVLCWLPFYVASVIGAVCESCIAELTWEITSNLLWCNSTINPFLYAALNVYFRENFVKFLGLDRWRRPTEPLTCSTDGFV